MGLISIVFPVHIDKIKLVEGFQIWKHKYYVKVLSIFNTVKCFFFFLLKDSTIKTVQGGVLIKIRMHIAVLDLVRGGR